MSEQPSVTEQQREAGADVPGDGSTDENVDEREESNEFRESLPEIQEGRGRMHARSNPKVPVEQQWDAEAQGPEHDGSYLEQLKCLR